MPEFARIAEAKNPRDLMRAPMESGLIPDCGDYYLRAFDRSYDHEAADDNDPIPEEVATPISNVAEVESELCARFLWALDDRFPRAAGNTISFEDAEAVNKGQAIQRRHVAQTVIKRFPGIQAREAMERIWGKQTRTRAERADEINLLLRHGYRPPLRAAALIENGTQGCPEPLTGILPIAKRAADFGLKGVPLRRLNPDAMKNRVRPPWPTGFFDMWPRIHLYSQAASRAFRRAYDQHFVWSHVEFPPLLSIKLPPR